MYKYYLDECGNTGDLIKPDFSLSFGGQPLFSLSCVGVDDEIKMFDKLSALKLKYGIENELKSTEIYSFKPGFFLELVKYLVEEKVPIFVELVDKKFCVIANLINSLIIPFYSHIDETDGNNQYARNHLADYMWHKLPVRYLELFNNVCIQRESAGVIDFLHELKSFFESSSCDMFEKNDISDLIAVSIDEFLSFCHDYGEDAAVKKYLPLPDVLNKSKRKSKIKIINILPHVHSFFNIIGRLNKYHLGDMADVVLNHDEQQEFDSILNKSKEHIVEQEISKNLPPTPYSDLDVKTDFELNFIKSEFSVGVQVADLIAGFYVRFINDVFYEKKQVESVYIHAFNVLVKYQNPSLPLGVNLVLPYHKQQSVFAVFNF